MTFSLHKNLPQLSITLPAHIITRFATVLQSGFFSETMKGTTISSFLNGFPGFTDEYKKNRLQTVFLNGDAIDDFEQSFSEDSCTLALSAAMPGLAGAIFRKQSPIGTLRKTAGKQQGTKQQICLVRVKFFNDIAVERGPELLHRGAVLNTSDLTSFLELRPSITEAITDLTINGIVFAPRELSAQLSKYNQTIITCKPAND